MSCQLPKVSRSSRTRSQTLHFNKCTAKASRVFWVSLSRQRLRSSCASSDNFQLLLSRVCSRKPTPKILAGLLVLSSPKSPGGLRDRAVVTRKRGLQLGLRVSCSCAAYLQKFSFASSGKFFFDPAIAGIANSRGDSITQANKRFAA